MTLTSYTTPQRDGVLTEYPSEIDYYSDEWTHDWSTSVVSTSHFNPCDNPNPPWWCEENEPVPIEPNILMVVGMFIYGTVFLRKRCNVASLCALTGVSDVKKH